MCIQKTPWPQLVNALGVIFRDAYFLTRNPNFSGKKRSSPFPICPPYLLSFRKKNVFGGGGQKISSPSGPCCCFVVVFSLNRAFYPTTSTAPLVSFLILHHKEMQIRWSRTVTWRKPNMSLKNQGTQIKRWRTGYESTTKKNATREIRATIQ